MWSRFVIEVQNEVIADLTRQLRLPEDRVSILRLKDGSHRVGVSLAHPPDAG